MTVFWSSLTLFFKSCHSVWLGVISFEEILDLYKPYQEHNNYIVIVSHLVEESRIINNSNFSTWQRKTELLPKLLPKLYFMLRTMYRIKFMSCILHKSTSYKEITVCHYCYAQISDIQRTETHLIYLYLSDFLNSFVPSTLQ